MKLHEMKNRVLIVKEKVQQVFLNTNFQGSTM